MRRLILAALLILQIPAAWARTVTDMAGRRVEIPDAPARIACLEVMCYPRMLMMHAEGRVVTRVVNGAPWAARTNPALSSIPAFASAPNLEDVMARHPDLALVSANYGLSRSALAEAGIPALVFQPVRAARSEGEFIADAKTMVRLAGQVLGGEAQSMAEEWCAYFDDRLRLVRGRIAAIPAEKRPKLYYARGPKATNTHGRGGFFNWVGALAGARMVIDEEGPAAANSQVSPETLIGWNPDVIVVGRQYAPEIVLDDPRLADLAAVRRHRVYSSPEGVFYWDGGPEQVLLLQFLAKRLYPDLFADLDLATEIKGYYARFYRTVLSDEEVSNLLEGRGPDGSRFNPMNN